MKPALSSQVGVWGSIAVAVFLLAAPPLGLLDGFSSTVIALCAWSLLVPLLPLPAQGGGRTAVLVAQLLFMAAAWMFFGACLLHALGSWTGGFTTSGRWPPLSGLAAGTGVLLLFLHATVQMVRLACKWFPQGPAGQAAGQSEAAPGEARPPSEDTER